jgi:hypothetical protein
MFSRSGTRPALLVAQNRDEVVEPDVVGGARHCRHPLRGLTLTEPSDIGSPEHSEERCYRIARFRRPPSDNLTLGRYFCEQHTVGQRTVGTPGLVRHP